MDLRFRVRPALKKMAATKPKVGEGEGCNDGNNSNTCSTNSKNNVRIISIARLVRLVRIVRTAIIVIA